MKKLGRPRKLSAVRVAQLVADYQTGTWTKKRLCWAYEISQETLYRILGEAGAVRKPKAETAPAPEIVTCFVCGGLATDWRGHPACTGRRAA